MTSDLTPTSPTLKIAINDANLFIDLHEIELTEKFFQLSFRFHTTQLIMSELEPEQLSKLQPFLEAEILVVRQLTREEIESLDNQTTQSKKLSIQDLSIYFYAKQISENCLILTGDNRLRKEAERQGLEVHGILWVFQRMIDEQILTTQKAIDKLTELERVNFWLPKVECERFREGWKNLKKG
jgi:predicted nucleic acid-binding protein